MEGQSPRREDVEEGSEELEWAGGGAPGQGGLLGWSATGFTCLVE